jgi:hypothetical protein
MEISENPRTYDFSKSHKFTCSIISLFLCYIPGVDDLRVPGHLPMDLPLSHSGRSVTLSHASSGIVLFGEEKTMVEAVS